MPLLWIAFLMFLTLLFLLYGVELPPAQALGYSFGGWFLVGLAVVLSRLFSTVRHVRVDQGHVRIRMLSGAVRQYPRATTRFRGRIQENTSRNSQASMPGLMLVATIGDGRSERTRLDLPPAMFEQVLHAVGAAPGAGDTTRGPRAFRLTHDGSGQTRIILLVGIGLFLVAGVVVLIGMLMAGEPVGLAVTLGVMCFLCAIPVFLVERVIRNRRPRMADEVVVGPDWVGVDGQNFHHSHLRGITIRPAGAVAYRHLTLDTRDGARHVFKFDQVLGAESFPEYDDFVELLQASAARSGVPVHLVYR